MMALATVLLVAAAPAQQCSLVMQHVGVQTKPWPTILITTPNGSLTAGISRAAGEDDPGRGRPAMLPRDLDLPSQNYRYFRVEFSSVELCLILRQFVGSLTRTKQALPPVDPDDLFPGSEPGTYRIFWERNEGHAYADPDETAALLESLLKRFGTEMSEAARGNVTQSASLLRSVKSWRTPPAVPLDPKGCAIVMGAGSDESGPLPVILIFSAHTRVPRAFVPLMENARAYVTGETRSRDMCPSIQDFAAGLTHLPPSGDRGLFTVYRGDAERPGYADRRAMVDFLTALLARYRGEMPEQDATNLSDLLTRLSGPG